MTSPDPYGAPQTPPLNAPGGASPQIGVQPGATAGAVFARYVVIFGTSGGMFIYSGTPGPGNPPVFSITTGTSDPYGNTVNAIVESTGAAGTWIQNSDGLFYYSGTPAAGNLVVALALADGTDAWGNDYDLGLLISGEGTITINGEGLLTVGTVSAGAVDCLSLVASGTITALGTPYPAPDQYPLTIGNTAAENEACQEMVNRLCVILQAVGLVASG